MKTLKGIRVLDMTTAYSGPFCTMQLADHGAEVIKVERNDGGDHSRMWTYNKDGSSTRFAFVNRNKKGITLNLKTDEGKELFLKLAEKCDVIVENFRGGFMERMGLGYEQVKTRNPRIIYASLSGFGQTGPWKTMAAYATMAEAMSGAMSVTGHPGSPPVCTGYSAGDMVAGLNTALGIVMALFYRDKTGKGQYIDVSMLDSMLGVTEGHIINYSYSGQVPKRIGNRDTAAYPYDVFIAKDGYYVFSVTKITEWDIVCAIIERPELVDDDRYDDNVKRLQRADEIYEIINAWSADKTREEVEKIISSYGLVYAPVLTIEEAIEHPQIKSRGMTVEIEDPIFGNIKMQGVPILFSESPGSVDKPAPTLGEDNETVYSSLLGLNSFTLAQYKKEQII